MIWPALTAGADDTPPGSLRLEARVVGVDGKPVERSSILFYRLLTPEQLKAESAGSVWREADGRAWKNVGGASTDDRLLSEPLTPGSYRVAAREGHHQATPVGVSDPVTLKPGDGRVEVRVQLRRGTTLTIRIIDAAGRMPLPGASVGLARLESDLPQDNFFGQEAGGQVTISNLPPGTYRLHASRSADEPTDLEYSVEGGDREIKLLEGFDQEVVLPMKGRPLTREEIERVWGWVAEGVVTDDAGRPVEGAEVRVATGMGTLMGGGRTRTGKDGRYILRFAEGWFSTDATNAQAAVFFVTKEGYVEASRTRPGPTMMARRRPVDGLWSGVRPEDVAVKGEPFRVDFRIAEPAIVEVTTEGPQEASALNIRGQGYSQQSGSARRLEGPTTRWALLPRQPWQFATDHRPGPSVVRSQPITLPGAGSYRLKLRFVPDLARGVDTLAIAGLAGPDGAELREHAVGDDPMARPPVPEVLQERGRAYLASMAAANGYWLGRPPAEVLSYEYRFRLSGGGEAKSYRVDDPSAPGAKQHAISYGSAIHHLASRPGDATFRQVEAKGDRVELTYTLKEPITAWAGVGVSGRWDGFFSMPLREGRLILDARSHTPLEHRSEDLAETFSRFFEVEPGRHVPLSIRIEQQAMRFDWSFQVFDPGLWLFASTRRDGDGDAAAVVDRVKVNGADARPIPEGRRPVIVP
jgi:hypothetical protein